jgi:hypothetical protein
MFPEHAGPQERQRIVKQLTAQGYRAMTHAGDTGQILILGLPKEMKPRIVWETNGSGEVVCRVIDDKRTKSAPPTATPPAYGSPPAGTYASSVTTPPSSPAKRPLLYDGKTFDQWRTLWQTELKTEKRTEAIQALAAFGRAGRGREAAEAILDVAAEYDFSTMDIPSPDRQLKQAVISQLALSDSRLSEADWLPVLEQRIDPQPSKRNYLACCLIRELRTTDDSVKKRLAELARHTDPMVRRGALTALCISDPSRSDPMVLELFRRSLASGEASVVTAALSVLAYHGRYLPEVLPALFHADLSVRQHARQALRNLRPDDAAKVVDVLIGVLQDQERTADHVEAIRAMSGMRTGPDTEDIQIATKFAPVLNAYVMATERKDAPELAVAILVAMRRNNIPFSEELKPRLKSLAGDAGLKGVKQEEELLFPPVNNTDIDGMGMGGGGGGGFF